MEHWLASFKVIKGAIRPALVFLLVLAFGFSNVAPALLERAGTAQAAEGWG